MAMGKRRRRPKQASMWVATQDLAAKCGTPARDRSCRFLTQFANIDGGNSHD
jgi:hypothetical protein